MGDVIEHNCGICVTHTLHDVYAFIKSLAHRGRDAVGIAAIGDDVIDVVKWKGKTGSFDLDDLHDILPPNKYHTFLAHTRYKTKGSTDLDLFEAHPHFEGGLIEDKGSHMIIRNCDSVIVHNGQINPEFFSELDIPLKTTCDTEALLHFILKYGEIETLAQIPGAYTFAFYKKRMKGVVVARDRTGIKPGYLGIKDGKYYMASESVAFRENGGKFCGDLIPGNIYYFFKNGEIEKQEVIRPFLQECFFEHNYIANEHSLINGLHVAILREKLGESLAEEFAPKDIDLVTFIPHCPETSARTYSERIKKPFTKVFYKMKNERSFQGPTSNERKISIKENLYLMDNVDLNGKTIAILDDSLIRGNVAQRVKELMLNAGVKKVYFLVYTPPIGIIGDDGKPRGCIYGVDMPADESSGKFIARGKTIQQLSDELGMEVHYLSKHAMLEAFRKLGKNPEHLCTFCIGGGMPF
jgi:amidophosphoribosyltransferase